MSSNQNNSSSRRTFSSPYLLGNLRGRNRPQNRPTPGAAAAAAAASKIRTGRDERANGGLPPRGSRSAPPNFQTGHPGIHGYYERRAEIAKDIKKKLLKSRLERLIDYQDKIAKEIDELEQDFESAMYSSFAEGLYGAPSSSEPKPKSKLKQFRVLGGCPGNLAYKIIKKPDKDGKIRSFSLEVDVKGYVAEKVEVDTDEDTMVIKAAKMNGTKRDLKVIAPTLKDMEKAYVHPPRFGLLVIDF